MQFGELIEALMQRGHRVVREDERAYVRMKESESDFALLHAGGWLQVAAGVLDADELGGPGSESALNAFLLRVHGRYLGCRFAYDEDGTLVIVSDLYPENVSAEHVEQVIAQLEFVATSLLPLVQSTVSSGNRPRDSAVDEAFNVSDVDDAHTYTVS